MFKYSFKKLFKQKTFYNLERLLEVYNKIYFYLGLN